LKKYGFLLPGLLVSQLALAQTQSPDTTLSSDKNIRNKVLSDIQDNLDKKTQRIDQTLSRLDNKVDSLDLAIAATRDAREKADKLLLRVQALEQKQQAIEENELMDVQSLKLRFGELTFEIRGIIGRYNELVAKYKNDPEIGLKVQALGVKLDALSDTFDGAFDPTEYINSATRMYLVN
jgi:chromosome segregation ATPase